MPVPFAWCHPGLCRHRNDGNGPWQTRTGEANGSGGGIVAGGDAECVAQSAYLNQCDMQLLKLISAWATLNQTVREQIHQIIDQAGSEQTTTGSMGSSHES